MVAVNELALSEKVAHLMRDDKAFIEQFFIIPNKDQIDVPFKFTPAQNKIHRERTLRHIVLKPSQIGSTSYATAVWFKKAAFHPNTTCVIVAHENFLSERLLSRTDKFYASLPDQIRPKMDHNSAHEKRFPESNSVMYIGTARSKVFGRGEPLHHVLFSECAFYPADAWVKAIGPALQRVPPSGTVLMESTPNGMDPIFHDHIQDVLKGKSAFSMTILYWWDELTNILPISHPLAHRFSGSPDNDEDLLIREWGLSEDQIRWRRWKKEELKDLFWQEHIESLDTAFLVVGSAYYANNLMAELQNNITDPIGKFQEARIWADPIPGAHYILGGDPGQGKVTESVATVIRVDQEIPEQVAVLTTKMLPDKFAIATAALAEYYNDAFVVPEVNGHGLAYIQKLKDIRYSNLYYRTSVVDRKTTTELGWYTSQKTKPFMMAEIHRYLHLGMRIPDETTVRQLAAARLDNGEIKFLGLDDHHDALGLALVGKQTHHPNLQRGTRLRSRRYSQW